jgi:hypothetical protein
MTVHYPHRVRQTRLLTFSQWLVTALLAFTLAEFLALVRHGPWLTHRVMAEVVGAALLGKLSYSVEKVALRRIRSRRQQGDT